MENQNKQETKSHSLTSEFVPYEQALQLKELGFNEVCSFYYKNKVIDDCINAPKTNSVGEFISKNFECTAPLYQQAFRWFRENYKLFSAVNVDQTMEPKFAYCISQYESTQFLDGWDTIVFNSDLYYTYEEAELACLKKLLEIAWIEKAKSLIDSNS